MLFIVINTLGLHLVEFNIISVSNIVEPTLLIQIFCLKWLPKYLKGTMIGSPVKLTTAVVLIGTPLCIKSAYTIYILKNIHIFLEFYYITQLMICFSPVLILDTIVTSYFSLSSNSFKFFPIKPVPPPMHQLINIFIIKIKIDIF